MSSKATGKHYERNSLHDHRSNGSFAHDDEHYRDGRSTQGKESKNSIGRKGETYSPADQLCERDEPYLIGG